MFNLRPHQQDAFDTMRLYDKGQLIMPTGSGKTLCMIFDAIREYRSDTDYCSCCTQNTFESTTIV